MPFPVAQIEAYDCFPLTFTLPADASLMKQAFKDKGGVWIMKPVRGLQVTSAPFCACLIKVLVSFARITDLQPSGADSAASLPQGRGIFLVSKLSHIEEWLKEQQAAKEAQERTSTIVAQQYIANPYLVRSPPPRAAHCCCCSRAQRK